MACPGANSGQGDCPPLPRPPRNSIRCVPRCFSLDNPCRRHLSTSKTGPDKQVTLFKEPLPKPLASQVCCPNRCAGRCGGLRSSPQPCHFFRGRISQRVELSRSQLQAIGERVSLAQAKIEKIKGSKKAIKVACVSCGRQAVAETPFPTISLCF